MPSFENNGAPPGSLVPEQPLHLLAEFQAAGPRQQSTLDAAPDAHPQPHRLLALLLSWIEAAGLNLYATHLKNDVTAQFAELRSAAAGFLLVEQVPTSQFLETRLDLKHMMRLKARLQESAAFAGQRRHGLLLDCVHEVRARKVMTGRDGDGIDFQGHHSLWGGARAPGPLLALAIYATTRPQRNFYELIHLATLPVLSRAQLFPVYRDEEREPLKMLIALIDWMASKGVKVTLHRPLDGGAAMDELVLSADGGRVLSVSLLDTPRVSTPRSETFKPLADFKSLATFRKYVAGFFLRGRR